MRNSTRIAATVASAGLIAAAMAAPATAKGSKAPGDDTLYDFLVADGRFTYLKAALDATGLADVAKSDDVQITVFAPTDAAFEKAADELAAKGVGDGTVPTLLGFLVDAKLADDVLLYHITDGRRWSNSVVPKKGSKMVDTLLGNSISVSSTLMVKDASAATSDATIIIPNVNASNGVAHAIDNVLVPLP